MVVAGRIGVMVVIVSEPPVERQLTGAGPQSRRRCRSESGLAPNGRATLPSTSALTGDLHFTCRDRSLSRVADAATNQRVVISVIRTCRLSRSHRRSGL